MKRRIALSIALLLGVVLVSLISSHSTAKAQPGRLFIWDTGVVTLGPNQTLRISAAQDGSGTDNANFRFKTAQYAQGICNGGVCKHVVASQTTSDLITLMPGEAVSNTFPTTVQGEAVRGVVLSNRPNLRVKAMIIDSTTGKVDAFFDIFTE